MAHVRQSTLMSGNKNLHDEAVEAVASEGGRLARGRPAVEHQQPALAAPAQRAPLGFRG